MSKKFGDKSNFKPSKVRNVPQGESFAQLWSKLIGALIDRPLSRYGYMMLLRFLLEDCRHAGKENGYLIVTYDQFEECGIQRRAIKTTLDELVAAKLLVIEHKGRASNGDGEPSLYRLTFLKSKVVPITGSPYYVEPSGDWVKLKGKPSKQPKAGSGNGAAQFRRLPPRKTVFSVPPSTTEPVPPSTTERREN